MWDEHLIKPETKVKLNEIDPGFDGKHLNKQEAEKELGDFSNRLSQLQELLYAERKRSLLVVLQAMDTGGKDGTIAHVMAGINPQGCIVTAFKTPSAEELAHDYLWRIHQAVPPKGMIGIFNRSHYEDVLIVRVHGLVPEDVWQKRYEQINAFEHQLNENGVIILKFYLHISKDEQKQRLQERLDDPTKHWKFAVGDLGERKLWSKYQEAYEDVLNRTSTKWAPWYVIPANKKWYRNYAVGRVIVEKLQSLDMYYPESSEELKGIVIPD